MMSVIVAIGPQNAFLLRQSVRRERAWPVASIFLFGDVLMILIGGFGVGQLIESHPLLKLFMTAAGALYILVFALNVARHILHPKGLLVAPSNGNDRVLFGACAVTFLNPHAIFDTVILVGTMALQFSGDAKQAFIGGAMAASALWFFGLAWIGQRMAPLLARQDVWRVLDIVIVVIMLTLAISLGIDSWHQIGAYFSATDGFSSFFGVGWG